MHRRFLFGFARRRNGPPAAQARPETLKMHGMSRLDPYAWMQRPQHRRELERYLNAENRHADTVKRTLRPLQRTIAAELIKDDKVTVHGRCDENEVVDGWEYATAHGVTTRRRASGGPTEVLLDENSLGAGVTVTAMQCSPLHEYFCWLEKENGHESGRLFVKHLRSNRIHSIDAGNVVNFVWANAETVVYTRANAQLRPHQVWLHRINSDQKDSLLFEDGNEEFFVDVNITKDKRYVTVNCNSRSSSEVSVLDTSNFQLQLVQKRRPNVEYFLDHHDDRFFVVSNHKRSDRFELFCTTPDLPSMDHWQPLCRLDPDDLLEDVDVFRHAVVIYAQRLGLPRVLVYYPSSKELVSVPLPHWLGKVTPGINRNYNAQSAQFIFNGYGSRECVLEWNFEDRRLSVKKQSLANWDWSTIAAKRLHLPIDNAVSVPVTVYHDAQLAANGLKPFVHRSEAPISQPTKQSRVPILVHSYASYGINSDPLLHPYYLPLLRRGWMIAIVHARGGSELGRQWALDGRRGNSISDIVAATRTLHHATSYKSDEGDQKRVGALGWSAGGLVLGSAVQHPDLSRLISAAVLHVPFLDPLSSMLDPDMPLTTTEYEMWGNPLHSAQDFKRLQDISPYDTLINGHGDSPYNTLSKGRDGGAAYWLTCGLRDQRVACWQVAKFAALLRAQRTPERGDDLVLVSRDDGHFADSADADADETAYWLAFLHQRTAIK